MDIRDTEAFKEKQKQILREQAKQELTAAHILTQFYRSEELRDKVYGGNILGTQGIMNALILSSVMLSSLTIIPKFIKKFPRLHGIFGDSYITRGIIIYMSMSIGRSIEQYRVENVLAKKEYEEFISAYNYYNKLKERKLESLSYAKRIEILTGIDISVYLKPELKQEKTLKE